MIVVFVMFARCAIFAIVGISVTCVIVVVFDACVMFVVCVI